MNNIIQILGFILCFVGGCLLGSRHYITGIIIAGIGLALVFITK